MSRIEEVRHIHSNLRQCGHDEAQKIKVVEQVRKIALMYLTSAVIAKVPPPYYPDEIRALYAAEGISLEWNLSIRGDTGVYPFCFTAQHEGSLSPSQQSAARLLSYCTEAIDKNAVTEQLQQWILDAYAGLDFDAVAKAERFPPRRQEGAISESTKHIIELAKNNRSAAAKKLFAIADQSLIGSMAMRTFVNHVTNARKIYPKERRKSAK